MFNIEPAIDVSGVAGFGSDFRLDLLLGDMLTGLTFASNSEYSGTTLRRAANGANNFK